MRTLLTVALACAACACTLPAAAASGPCSDDIAAVGRQLSASPAMGPVTSGTLSGTTPAAGHTGQPMAANTSGTSADKHIGGDAGTKELNAASSNVATSDADVRQQQAGHPTAAAQANGGSAADDRMSQAKVAWQKAVDLNAQGDAGCKAPLDEAKADLAKGR